jgi:hypothetical protein
MTPKYKKCHQKEINIGKKLILQIFLLIIKIIEGKKSTKNCKKLLFRNKMKIMKSSQHG